MTTSYFICHAQSDKSVREDRLRHLSGKGVTDTTLITEYLRDKQIGIMVWI